MATLEKGDGQAEDVAEQVPHHREADRAADAQQDQVADPARHDADQRQPGEADRERGEEGGVERWDCLVYRELEVEGRGEGEKLEQQRQAKRLDERALEPDEIEPELRQAEPRALIDAGERAGGREFERDAGDRKRTRLN